LPLDVLGVKP